MISIHIPGKPLPKARPRFSRHKGKVRTYDPQSDEATTLQWQLRARMKGKPPLSGPLHLDLVFSFACPPSRARFKEEYHSVKPDLDNLIKWCGDVGNGILWEDDKQIVSIVAKKIYGEPGTSIMVREIE